jgi:DNA (cytosine-5)-methyltransferase 1
MWKHMARIICEVQPRLAFVENSPLLTKRGLSRVLGDLASMGYNARWGVLGASQVGANHKRDRIWIVGEISNSNLPQQQGGCISIGIQQSYPITCNSRWWETEPNVGRMANGVAAWVDRLKATGNGQVPLCAATAFRILTQNYETIDNNRNRSLN